MIRWKQRDIHEKREARKLKLAKLNSERELNGVLRPRIQAVVRGVEEGGWGHYRAVQRRLQEQPSPDKPNTGAPNQPTYDMMLGQLLGDVWKEAACLVDGAEVRGGEVVKEGKKVDSEPTWASEAAVPEGKAETMARYLKERLSWHVAELDRRDEEVKKEIAEEEHEQKKKITSEDIKEGWSATSVVKPKPSPLENAKPSPLDKKAATQTIEVLNPGVVSEAIDSADDRPPNLLTTMTSTSPSRTQPDLSPPSP
jgi:cell division cycle protein 37